MGIPCSLYDPGKPFENRVSWPPYRDIYIQCHSITTTPTLRVGGFCQCSGSEYLGQEIYIYVHDMYDELCFLSADTNCENSQVPYENLIGNNEGPPQV